MDNEETTEQPWTCKACGGEFEADARNDNPQCPHCGAEQAPLTFPGSA